MINVQQLCISYNNKKVVDGINFDIDVGDWLMIIGPNGAGKTSIIKAILNDIPYLGTSLYQGEDMKRIGYIRMAKLVGVLNQNNNALYSYTVDEVVRLGRYCHRQRYSRIDRYEDEWVDKALNLVNLLDMRYRSILTLSGGELQRVFLAQLFAQNPKIIILDEPTNNLDIKYQCDILELISEWVKEDERAVISIIHDLQLAKTYGNKALLINKQGKQVAYGINDVVMNDNNINELYSMDVCRWLNMISESWISR